MKLHPSFLTFALLLGTAFHSSRAAQAELKNLALIGGIEDGKARLVIEANLTGFPGDKEKLLFATALQHALQISREKHSHTVNATFDILQGEAKELALTLTGEGDIKKVTGDYLLDWSVRQETNGTRSLVLRPRKAEKPLTQFAVTIIAERETRGWSHPVQPLTFAPAQGALFHGYVKVEVAPELSVQPTNTSGLVPIETKFLPDALRTETKPDESEPLAFRFHGSAYALPLIVTLADPEAARVVFRDFQLQGQLADQSAAFTLTTTARVKDPRGRSVVLLSGGVALAELERHPDWRIRIANGQFVLVFDKPGEFPLRLKFNAAVRQSGGWNNVEFRVAPSALQPIALAGLGADTQFEFTGAARPERSGSGFKSFLPPDGAVKLAWKETKAEAEGKLFYAAEMLEQISIKPGLLFQLALIDGKVMQGELTRMSLLVRGSGRITQVDGVYGTTVLNWKVEPVPNSTDRRIDLQFNQPQKSTFAMQVSMQSELGAFPQAVDVTQLLPEGATRFAGHVRVVNDGAVRLEVLQSTGLSQISPDRIPQSDKVGWLATGGNQVFAYRFSTPDFALRVNADNVLPEVSVSQLLAYHLGETELAIDAEFELDIREAPVREVLLRVPKGFAVARLAAAGHSDYFLREPADQPDAELRIVYGQPIAERQVIQLRLERNGALGQPAWTLPRVEVTKAKSTRGHIAVSADAGFRLTPDRTVALTDIATAFFPRKVAGIQAAFRLSEPAWEAALRVERLPQTIQADVFHLFSIGDGIAYGSSTINYLISGAPVSAFQVALSDEYFNIEFTGKDVRNWQKTTNGYSVQLNTPVSGPYTLLATCERKFKAQGDTLTFTGARPLDVLSEQGHTLVVSAYQFQVKPANVSPGLLQLETAEVPAEYRLFFDAPILAAYRYTARPFNLQLALSPLQQGETLGLVVDRAALTTRISKDGEVLTDVRYFVKNRGNTHFRLTLPDSTTLWSVTVNGVTVVPVKDGTANLIPLSQRADPNSVQTLDLKLASRSKSPTRVTALAPIVTAPVLLAEWRVEPDTGQRLTYSGGTLAPASGVADISGFAGLARMFSRGETTLQLLLGLGLIVFALWAWRWATREGTHRFSVRHTGGTLVGIVAVVMSAGMMFTLLFDTASRQSQVMPHGLSFLAPVQQSGSALSVEVANLTDELTFGRAVAQAWPALLALVVWGYVFLRERDWLRPVGVLTGWTLLAWAALRWPNGAPMFFVLLMGFLLLHVVLPAVRTVFQLPRRPRPPSDGASAAATAALLVGGLIWVALGDGRAVADVIAVSGTAETQRAQRTAVQTLISDEDSSFTHPAPSTASPSASFAPLRLKEKVATTDVLLLAQATPSTKPLAKSDSPAPLAPRTKEPALAESVIQDIRVEEQFALATAKVRWHATKDQLLPLLFEPAVVTRISYPNDALKLVQSFAGGKRVHQLLAQQDGSFDIEVQYQLHVTKKDGEGGFALPTQHGLVNRLTLTLVDTDADVTSTAAVSIERNEAMRINGRLQSNAVFNLILAPATNSWIGWQPRSRDVKREKAVFFAEWFQLFAPVAGVIEGVHQAQIRPAQGELSELIFDVPGGATITDVIDPAFTPKGQDPATGLPLRAPPSIISLWRFDPDTRKLRVTLNPPQSRPFALVVRSQVATGPLPFEQTNGLISVNGAAGQLGSVGIATGNEVQLDTVTADAFSAINLEDFPGGVLNPLRAQIAGLTLRRAFRYTDASGRAALKASAVEPDVRVATQETLSLGDDRTVLAANVAVTITRAGIFRLSFLLATNLDVESISGAALSHWTELKSAEGRIITLHLKGKTEGRQQFSVNLAGPGTKVTTNYLVPRFILREASKQNGQLVVVPEQGMRLQAGPLTGVTQLDPQKSGIRQKGVLAFNLLQAQWSLALDLERVDAWVQVTSLQHLTVTEAQVKVAANLQYQIENTGLKALRVQVPTNAESVRFRGEQVADFLPVAGTVTNDLQTWEVKFHRRIIGKYLLQATWQTPVAGAATSALVRGVQAADANLQRGFVTVQSGGRLQVRADTLPAALQPAEWQGIPRALLQDLPGATANYTFRLVEPAFQLALTLERHEATKLLAARVNNVTLTSVISDEGVMLTQVKLELIPGDKRLLNFTLPAEARFWFAFVNQNGVWPWRDQGAILIPLEQQSRGNQVTTVELFYSSRIGKSGASKLDLALLGPKFDLPLENITWQVYLNEKWRLADWAGTLQLQEDGRVATPVAVDLNSYLANEVSLNREKTRAAEQQLSLGNSLLERGDPQQARQAFQSAFGLSTHDQAFNEDARVQLHNLKLQQALVGLNVLNPTAPATGGQPAPAADNLKQLRNRKDVAYTQQEAKQIIDANNAADNDAYMRVAERLIQQQDAAVTAPTAIRAAIPQQGRLLTFRRAVQIDTTADLKISIEATARRAAPWGIRLGTLGAVFAGLGLLVWLASALRSRPASSAS